MAENCLVMKQFMLTRPQFTPNLPESSARFNGELTSWNTKRKLSNSTMSEEIVVSDSITRHTPLLENNYEPDNNGNPMRHEDQRLETFKSWPASAPIQANKLAKAGFYYTGEGFAVKCFSCKGIVDEWDFGDQAIQKHESLFPNCDFVQRKSDNVPLTGLRSNGINSSISNRWESISSPTTFQTTLSRSCSSNAIPSVASTTVPSTADEKTWHSFSTLLSEAERLKTFKGWPSLFVKPEDLARAGFFYLRELDKVQCFFCRGIVGEWEAGDVPITEHHRHFPRCPLIKGYNVGNIPIIPQGGAENVPSVPLDDTWGGDVTGRFNYEMETFSAPEKGHMTPNKLACLGITEHNAPRHPNYATYEARLRTYHNWPKSIPQRPEAMADAGFYYAGVSDHVRCFCCDGGLRNWEPKDDPWVEHARWFGKCCFLGLMKGHEFVAEAKIQRPPVLPQPSTSSQNEIQNSQVEQYMNTKPVELALSIGVNHSTIRQVMARNLELTGSPYHDSNEFIGACMDFPHTEVKLGSSSSTASNPSTSSLNSSASLNSTNSANSISSLSSERSFQGTKPLKSPDLSVEDENRFLKEMRLCKICMDDEIGVVFLPCGHLISCTKCAPSLTNCPLCRKIIHGTVRTFLS